MRGFKVSFGALRGGSWDEDPADVVLVRFAGSFPEGFGGSWLEVGREISGAQEVFCVF